MILITDSDKTRRDTVAEMFYYMGILARSVKPEQVDREIHRGYSALLFTSPESTHGAAISAARIRAVSEVTVAAICSEKDDAFELVFPKGSYSASIAASISRYRRERGLSVLGKYECMGFNASSDAPSVTYLGEPINLTRTEAMILRYLIRSYPTPACPSDILKFAFRPTRAPELSSVRTHISIMNKKLREAIGRPLTDTSARGGYVLSGAVTATV